MIWAGSMMLAHLGERAAADAVLEAIENVLARGKADELTRDMGGTAGTDSLGEAIEKELHAVADKAGRPAAGRKP